MPGFLFGEHPLEIRTQETSQKTSHATRQETLIVFVLRLLLLLSLLRDPPSRPRMSFASGTEMNAVARLAAKRRQLSGEFGGSGAVVAGLGIQHSAPPFAAGNVLFDVAFREKNKTFVCSAADTEPRPKRIQMNRDALKILAFAHVLLGKPVATFPGHALEATSVHAASHCTAH
jgi:hypothetical protein